jgi:hypothetical protein
MDDLEKRVGEAITLFWTTRDKQSESQGVESGQKDAGLRSAVTGGKHLDGFTDICRDLFIESGVPEAHVFWKDKRELPGWFRAEKSWDLVVVADGHLLAVIEFKAQVGPSFGNNFNNRTEEALGNATDLWRSNFGQPAGSGAGVRADAAIPEPATRLLLILATTGWSFLRRQAA